MANLIPQHYTDRERKLDLICEAVFERIMGSLWTGRLHDPMTCDARFLFAVGKYYGVEYWWQNITEEEHRAIIAAFPMIKRRRGTLWSVKQALNVIDKYGRITEGDFQYKHDGIVFRDGSVQRGYASHWAEFVIVASRAISNAQGLQLRKLMESVAPARSRLIRIDYTIAALTRNGTFFRNGTYNRGAA
ncbi:MAG: phage tail protein [Campylobacterota bacterium]